MGDALVARQPSSESGVDIGPVFVIPSCMSREEFFLLERRLQTNKFVTEARTPDESPQYSRSAYVRGLKSRKIAHSFVQACSILHDVYLRLYVPGVVSSRLFTVKRPPKVPQAINPRAAPGNVSEKEKGWGAMAWGYERLSFFRALYCSSGNSEHQSSRASFPLHGLNSFGRSVRLSQMRGGWLERTRITWLLLTVCNRSPICARK